VSDASAYRVYYQENWVWAVAFSPDGRYLIGSLADNVEATAGVIRVWSVIR